MVNLWSPTLQIFNSPLKRDRRMWDSRRKKFIRKNYWLLWRGNSNLMRKVKGVLTWASGLSEPRQDPSPLGISPDWPCHPSRSIPDLSLHRASHAALWLPVGSFCSAKGSFVSSSSVLLICCAWCLAHSRYLKVFFFFGMMFLGGHGKYHDLGQRSSKP